MSVSSSLPEVGTKSGERTGIARIILAVLALLLLAIAAVAAYAFYIARSAVPQMDGSIPVPGLSAKVRVVRNEQGVPTIDSATLNDLFFAQGYVTAQDRLWQMDILRRAASGELSEIIGNVTLDMDRKQRILGLRVAAEAAEKNIPARDRPYFDAYVRGVNAFIDSHRDRLPLEFRLLKYQPRPWTVTDCLLIGANMIESLNHYSYARALTREKILAKIGPELTADLYVNSSWRDRPPTAAKRGMEEEPSAASSDSDDDDDDDDDIDPDGTSTTMTSSLEPVWGQGFVWGRGSAPSMPHPTEGPSPANPSPLATAFAAALTGTAPSDPDPARPGSNDWVVSGQHSTTGKPLLSNDMHLDHQMPNLWYEAHLRSGTFDVVGVTLPGVPFVIVGHNQRIGWGFTNVGPTVEDDFIEEFNDRGQYKVPTPKTKPASHTAKDSAVKDRAATDPAPKDHPAVEWRDPEHRTETIKIKGQPDVTLDVVTTRHGPIITDLIPGETRKVALRWTLQDGVGLVFFDVDSAQNWDEFREAFSALSAPGQNVVYADVDGNIGYQATGRVPIRAAGDGSLPVSGSDDAHEWVGWIPFDDLPHVYDPPSGIIATANGRITPDGYKYSISTEWDGPWRTGRIYRVLESGRKFAPADMLALQTDVSSTFDHYCADKFIYALDHAPKLSPRAKRAADILRDWDGRISADSAAPTIETAARQELVRLLLEPKLGPAPENAAAANAAPRASSPDTGQLSWKSYRWGMSTVWLDNVLTKQPARWLPPGYADYGAVLTAAVENAVKQPDVPADLAKWKWGEREPLKLDHPVLSKLPLIGKYTGPGRHPLSGDHYTVDQVYKSLGPSERLTWNFTDFDASTLNVVTGESGVFLSPYYMDQWPAWYRGSTFTLPFSAGAIAKHRTHELILEPK